MLVCVGVLVGVSELDGMCITVYRTAEYPPKATW